MVYNTIYELQWEGSPGDWYFNIFLLISAVLAILKAIDCWKEKTFFTSIIFIVIAILAAGFSAGNFYYGRQYDMNTENAYVEAYKNGNYKIVEGRVKDFTKARQGYYFYIDTMCFDYEGPKIEEGSLVKIFYIEEGEGGETYHIMRVDLCEDKN